MVRVHEGPDGAAPWLRSVSALLTTTASET